MKHIINRLMALTAVTFAFGMTFTSCSDDDDNNGHLPQIYIEQPYYSVAKGEVTINIEADKAPESDVVIPVKFGGTAVRDIDFTTDDARFVIKAGETKGSMVIKRVLENIPDDNLELFINLTSAPAGYSLGLMNYASVNLLGNNGYIMTFNEPTGVVGIDGEFKIALYDMKGSYYRPKADEYFSIVIDEEESTAVLGEHYELPDGPIIKYPANSREGVLKINMLKVEEGKDKIVFSFAEKDGFAAGSIPTMTVTIKGPDVYNGTWVFDHSDLSDLDMYADYCMIYPELAPTGSSADKIVFAGDSYLEYDFTPQFSGDFKKYFGTETRKVTFLKEDKEFRDQTGSFPLFTRLNFPGINFAFSSKVSDIRDAQIAVKLVEEDGKEYLKMWIGDWIPEEDEYGGDLKWWIYDDTYMWGYGTIRIYFTRQ